LATLAALSIACNMGSIYMKELPPYISNIHKDKFELLRHIRMVVRLNLFVRRRIIFLVASAARDVEETPCALRLRLKHILM
jgi:hypothetical protein